MNMLTSNRAPIIGLFLLIFMMGGILGVSRIAQAEGPVIRSGESIGVGADQLLEGDFYGLGNTITISGEAARDVYALAGTAMTNATVKEDLVIVAGVIQVNGDVEDDARLVGGEVIIAEHIEGDVVVMAGTLHILSTASISGDLIFLGGEIQIDGPIEGTVYGTGGTIRINSQIGGDVTVRAGETLTLGDAANVKGNIVYRSKTDIVRAQGAVVTGTLTKEAFVMGTETPRSKTLILNMLILLFSSLTVFFLAKSRMNTLTERIMTGYGHLGLIGLGMMFALPVVAAILMASVIGIIVGLALLFAYVVLMLLALVCLPILGGVLLERLLKRPYVNTFFTIITGVLITVLLLFIPFIGPLVLFAGFVILVGALCEQMYRFFKNS